MDPFSVLCSPIRALASFLNCINTTGAGKSTLMTSLMRLVELSSGQIVLDDVDIQTLGLRRLRSSIAVIPQDPVLFSGTVKSNLDPFDQFDRERLMDVLERVGLWSGESASAVSSLEDRVLQDGNNFSAGQR
jgi:ATP-binding cassette, subfamily C (CFTR/MRP), member 1